MRNDRSNAQEVVILFKFFSALSNLTQNQAIMEESHLSAEELAALGTFAVRCVGCVAPAVLIEGDYFLCLTRNGNGVGKA